MALPANGPISIGAIRTELLNTGKSTNFQLSRAGVTYGQVRDIQYVPVNQSSTSKPNITVANNAISRPLSAWYSYNHSATLTCPISVLSPDVKGGNYLYYKITITGSAGTYSPITVGTANYDGDNYLYYLYKVYPFTNTGDIIASPPENPTLVTIFYGSSGATTYFYQLPSTSNDLHFVLWNNTVPVPT